MAKINLKGVETEFKPLPEGVYEVALESWKEAQAKKKDDPNWKPSININAQLDVVAPEEFAGRKLFKTWNLGANSLWSFKKDMISIGIDPDDLEDDDLDTDVVLSAVKTGGTFQVNATIREYNKRLSNDVEIIDPNAEATATAVAAGGW